MRNQRGRGLLRLVAGVSLALLGGGCSSSHEAAPRSFLVDRHSSIDPAALGGSGDRGGSEDRSGEDRSAASDVISSDAGTAYPFARAIGLIGGSSPSTDGGTQGNTPGGGVDPGAGNAGICALSFDGGACTTPMNVYWHNPVTGMCELKVYGGCEGNGNRFASMGECVEVCGGTAPAPCEFAGEVYPPGQLVDTVCGGCECDPAGSGEVLCPPRGDAGPCVPNNLNQIE